MIRVLYDSSLAHNPAGTGTYVRGVLAELGKREDLQLVVASFRSDSAATLDRGQKSTLSRARNSLLHAVYYTRTLTNRAVAEKCDVVFCPGPLVPLRGRTPVVMTIYDLVPVHFGSTQDWLSRRYAATMLRIGIRRAQSLCTISHAVRDEIVTSFRRAPAHVQVAYPGPNPELLSATESPIAMPARPYALMVGTIEPRKNHVTALRALAEHRRQYPASELMLVLAGSSGWHYEPVIRAIAELGLGDHVIRTGQVDPGSLKWLYRHARALLFPSIYEGFGLPVLEALYLGCPVVAAGIPSVMEITGETATLLKPTDVAAWAGALNAVAAGAPPPQLPGLERAQRFNWKACADSVSEAIKAALASR